MKSRITIMYKFVAALLGLLVLSNTFVNAQDDLLEREEKALQAAVMKASPSVIQLELVGGLESQELGPVSGLAVTTDGFVLASAAMIPANITSILATTPSGKRAAAKVISHDYSRNLVLLKVNTEETYPLLEAIPKDEIIVGQWSIALGRTFSREFTNQSVGIISASNRVWGKAIQSDAKISPANYGGPLIDIHGRAFGILTPLTPNPQGGQSDGSEWYDSGIGFAVPIADIMPYLEKLKQGDSLYPGRLGISLTSGNIYDLPAEVVAVQPKSPARDAGIQKGDSIFELAGKPVTRQSELRHILGAHYAGDTINIKVTRDDKIVTAELTLAQDLEPYEHPFLGILPDRNYDQQGVLVRHVYPNSAAEQAGLKSGDIISRLNETPLKDHNQLRVELANFEPSEEVQLHYSRGGQVTPINILLAPITSELPVIQAHPLPAAPAPANNLATGLVEIKLPEEANDCHAIIPANYRADVPHGLVVWLHAPGDVNDDILKQQWATLAAKYHLIVLAPKAADDNRWQPTEIEFIRKTMDNIINTYNVDRNRIVSFGRQAGGAMSLILGFSQRDLVRGVIPVDAPFPLRAGISPNDPAERLAVHAILVKGSPVSRAVGNAIKALEAAKYPVSRTELESPGKITDELRESLTQWIDSLDRI
ncbi:PDZ domain-containing protein [Pirellulaceae bacterium]|nr:PDZ domain-containing protein [Pirellulaceae bacterium]